jgi:hypothetical protein
MNVQELKSAWLQSIINYDQIIMECYNNYKDGDAYNKNDKLLGKYADLRSDAYSAYFTAKRVIK